MLLICQKIRKLHLSLNKPDIPQILLKEDDPEKFILMDDDIDNTILLNLQKKYSLSKDSKLFIKENLMRSGVFINEVNQLNLSLLDIDNIVNAFKSESFSENEILFYQNDPNCSILYIAKRGIFMSIKESNEKESIVFKEGSLMGDTAFFHEVPPNYSLMTDKNNAVAFSLTKRDFKLIAEKGRDLRNIKLLESLSDCQKLLFKEKVTIANFKKGNIILRKGSPITAIYLILSGVVQGESSSDASLENFLLPGNYFGENVFLSRDSFGSGFFFAVRETSVCIINEELYNNSEVFGPVRAQIIRNATLRKKESDILSSFKTSSTKDSSRYKGKLTQFDSCSSIAVDSPPSNCSPCSDFFASFWDTLSSGTK